MEHNWNILSVRNWVLQNQVQKGYCKLENGHYFAKDGFGNYANFPLIRIIFGLDSLIF